MPELIAVASANLVSGLFGSSVYEEQLVRANIPFLHARPPKSLSKSSATGEPRTAFDACTRSVVTFKSIEKVGVIERALATTRHNGFPVVDADNMRYTAAETSFTVNDLVTDVVYPIDGGITVDTDVLVSMGVRVHACEAQPSTVNGSAKAAYYDAKAFVDVLVGILARDTGDTLPASTR